MIGVLRSALIFYSAGKLQRAFLGISLFLIVTGPLILTIAAPTPDHLPAFHFFYLEFPLAAALSGTLAVAASTFRAASALHTLRLVPYARLQLASGVLLGEVLLAALVTINVGFLHRATPTVPLTWGSLTNTFIVTLSTMTLWALWIFYLISDVPWVRWAAAILGLSLPALAPVQPRWSVCEMTGISAPNFVALVAITASSLFAVWYWRTRHVGSPVWQADGWLNGGAFRARATEKIAATRRSVVNAFLLGQPSVRRACLGTLSVPIFFNAAVIMMFWNRDVLRPALEGTLPALMIVFVGSAADQFGSKFAQRSRTLWMHGGYTRGELFKMAEILALRCLAFIGVPVLVLSMVEWIFLAHDIFDLRVPLLLTLTTAICSVYVGLINVKREWWNFPGCTGLCLLIYWTAVPFAATFLDTQNQFLSIILPAVQIVAALALRSLAKKRWERLDWLICKPARSSSRGLQPVG